ncbi:hypothetical protein SAMD00024442_18_32 [Candidatus Symbiothrix dinenymphae]|nr:hypothetical protein SAMD00024442_18_32 [Candidatus Symbiothrix dinenymphae]
MKKFFIRLLFFIPVPLLIVATNYFVDPANLFREGYESGIVDYWLQGYNVVTGIVNYDERSLQRQYIEKMPECPTEIVLGSSRVFLIGQTMTGNDRLMNHGVSGASLEDLMAIYYLYEKKGCNQLHKVLIGLDPWLLNVNHGDTRWKTLKNEYNAFANILLKKGERLQFGASWSNFYKYAELFSLSYLKSSIAYLRAPKNPVYKPTKEAINEDATRRMDGSIDYGAAFRNLSKEEIDKEITKALNHHPIYHMGNFTSLNKDYCLLFSNYIEYLQQKNIEVEFVLAPLHPQVYDYFQKSEYYKIGLDAETYFVNYATKHQITVYGSFNPEKYRLGEFDFYDGFHPKEATIEKILQRH